MLLQNSAWIRAISISQGKTGDNIMKTKVIVVIVTVTMMLLSAQAGAEKKPDAMGKEDLEATIAHLLEYVRTSDVVFIRNGKEHSAEDAVEHIQKKYNHYKKKIKTPEDFIEKSATKSMMSGKLYQIKLKDGTIITSKDWLLAELDRYRNSSGEAVPDTSAAAPPDTTEKEE
jgi:predicted GTPase